MIEPIKYLKSSGLPAGAHLYHFKLGRDVPLVNGIDYTDIKVGRRMVFWVIKTQMENRKYYIIKIGGGKDGPSEGVEKHLHQ